MSDTTKELAACLEYARIVNRVLPANDDAQREVDRMAAESLSRYLAKQPSKVIKKRSL